MYRVIHLAWMRASEQPEKMLYLLATVMLAVLTWIVLSAFTLPSLLSGAGKAINARIEIINGLSQSRFFPQRYLPQIRQIPGVERVYWITSAAFFCRAEDPQPVTITGYGGDMDSEFHDKGISEREMEAWRTTENGLLVGEKLAKHCGFVPGMRISPPNLLGSGEMPLEIITIAPDDGYTFNRWVYGHYDYINRFMSRSYQDQVGRGYVHATDPAQMERLAQRIEREFQAFDPPLGARVSSGSHTVLGRFGQAQAVLWPVMGAMGVCVVLVFVAITAHLVAQRRAGMAMLQVLGFDARSQFFGLMLELLAVMAVGAVLGMMVGQITLALLSPWVEQALFSAALHSPEGALLVVWPVLGLVLMIALAWPAAQIAKLKPMDSMRF